MGIRPRRRCTTAIGMCSAASIAAAPNPVGPTSSPFDFNKILFSLKFFYEKNKKFTQNKYICLDSDRAIGFFRLSRTIFSLSRIPSVRFVSGGISQFSSRFSLFIFKQIDGILSLLDGANKGLLVETLKF